ncbi:MAG: SRPBCC family protein [Bacteroidota bacterium]|nr:SRPBCC family protein [Bacteroidota bacterium]
MTTIESDVIAIDQSQEKIFLFLSDFNNFEKLMPKEVSEWKSTKDTCSFNISGMAQVALKIESTTPNSKVHIASVEGGKLPFAFTLDALIKSTGDNSCTGQLIFEGDIPIFIRPMVKGPLEKFFNALAHKMKDIK